MEQERACCQQAGRPFGACIAERYFPTNIYRCQHCGICPVSYRARRAAGFVDTGSVVTIANGVSLSGGASWRFSAACRGRAGGRCPVGDGRGFAQPGGVGCHRRGLGQSGGSGFHGDQAIGHAIRCERHSRLADPQSLRAGSKCCPKPLACCIAAFHCEPGRPESARRPMLACRTVSLAPFSTRQMDRTL